MPGWRSATTPGWSCPRSPGERVSVLAGLHALFFLATALHARPGDAGCLITSAEWLDVNYGSLIRDLLLGPLGGASLDVLRPEAIAFEDAMTTAAVATFACGSPPEGMRIRLAESADDLAELGRGQFVHRTALERSPRWSAFLYGRGPVAPPEGLVPLGSVARVHRGVVTGANDLFVLTREQARRHGIERWCRPAITSAREIFESGGVLRDGPQRRLLLELPRGFDRTAEPAVDAYLKAAEQPRGRIRAAGDGVAPGPGRAVPRVMTTRRQFTPPPIWDVETLESRRRQAIADFVRERMEEGASPYREAFARNLELVQELFRQTRDLLDLGSGATLASHPELLPAARYLSGPPVSADDLNTLAGSRVSSRKRHDPGADYVTIFRENDLAPLAAFLDTAR
jgi:hypothetical protein